MKQTSYKDAFQESEERFNAIIEGNVNAMILANRKGEITMVNKIACQLFGYSKDEFLAICIDQLVPDYVKGHAKTREHYHKTPTARSMGAESELSAKRKDGSTFDVEIGLNPIKLNKEQFVLATIQDVTERKKAQQQAKGIQSVVNEGWCFIEFNPDGTIINANSNFIRLLGHKQLSEIKGEHHRIFCEKEYVKSEEYEIFWKELRAGKTQSGEFERISKSGDLVWINASYSPVKDSKGNVIKVMKIAADISENKRLEKEMKALKARELQEAQNQLIQSDKMATLGNLMAGIAHEINTPLGAIKASIEGILDNDTSYQDFFKLFKILSEEEILLFLEMINTSVENNVAMSSKEERQHRRKLRKELEEKGVNRADEIADIMADLHLIENIGRYEILIFHKENLQIFRTAMSITVQHRNGGTIKIGVDKASKIIFALKSYSHFDQEDLFTETNIVEGIENIITLYTNQLKQGTELVKHYDDIPAIKCLPDQLGQVWTNLIANAIHAMNGLGTLTIRLENQAKSILVKIGDSGQGIPKDVAAHIFTPFFTTKSSGEGSGLGLDLVKKIVDKHGGNISFTSKPGETIFTVEIPKEEYIDQLALIRFEELKEVELKKDRELKQKMAEI